MTRTNAQWALLFALLLGGLILAVAKLLIPTVSILLLIFAGILFGIFLNGLSRGTRRVTRLSYHWSLALVVVLLATIVGVGCFYAGSQAVTRATELSSEVQTATQTLTERIQENDWAQQYLPDLSEMQKSLADGSVLPQLMKGMQWIGWTITAILVIFFVGLYNAFDPDLYQSGLVRLVPRDKRDRATEVMQQLHSALGRWILGRLISMSIIGICTAIGLSVIGVSLPITLGVVAALLTFIPNIGPVLAAIPQALLAMELGSSAVTYVIIFNIVLQGVESYLVTPVVQRYEVSLPPALTIFAQLIMGVTIGIIGVMMAAPLTAAIMVLIQMLYIQDRLGDPDAGSLANRD